MKRRATLQLIPNSSKKVQVDGRNSRLFENVLCLVETYNDDGTDASPEYEKILRSYGATVKENLSEGLTHYFLSNPVTNRYLAAPILNIPTLSPLWIEQCRESNKIVPIKDFLFSTKVILPSQQNSSFNTIKEPKANAVKEKRNVESPHFSSSQRSYIPSSKPIKKYTSKNNNSKGSSLLSSPTSIISNDDDDDVYDDAENIIDDVKPAFIPLPVFKTYVAPPIALENIPRRSERILDNSDDRSSSNKIDPSQPLLVISNDEWPPSPDILKSSKSKNKNKASRSSTQTIISSHNNDVVSSTSLTKDIVISISSFDDNEGERSTLVALITSLIKLLKTTCPMYNVKLLKDKEDVECQECTHLIAPAVPKRTLKILFAIAKGIPILTIEWLYQCLHEEKWVDIANYCHKKISNTQLLNDNNQLDIFCNMSFYIGLVKDPKPTILRDLINVIGGSVENKLDRADYLLFGDQICAEEWLDLPSTSKSQITYAFNLGKTKRIVSTQYIFDCIEQNMVINTNDLDDSKNDVLLSLQSIESKSTAKKVTKIQDKSKNVDNDDKLSSSKILQHKDVPLMNKSATEDKGTAASNFLSQSSNHKKDSKLAKPSNIKKKEKDDENVNNNYFDEWNSDENVEDKNKKNSLKKRNKLNVNDEKVKAKKSKRTEFNDRNSPKKILDINVIKNNSKNKTHNKSKKKSDPDEFQSDDEIWNDEYGLTKSQSKIPATFAKSVKDKKVGESSKKLSLISQADIPLKSPSTEGHAKTNMKKTPINTQTSSQILSQTTKSGIIDLISLKDISPRKSPRIQTKTFGKSSEKKSVIDNVNDISSISKISNNKMSLEFSTISRSSRFDSPTW